MALGDGNNQNKKNDNDRAVYSAYSNGNPDSAVDPSKYSITFWGGLMKLAISPKVASNDNSISYDHENNIELYLSHTKAMILAREIKDLISGKAEGNSVGVHTGMKSDGLVLITDGKELGVTGYCLVLMKLDENNIPVSSFAYEFRQNYHYAIRNFNQDNGKYDKVFYENLELEQLVLALEEYYKAMVGAQAYAASNMAFKFDISRFNQNIGLIMDKLGIQRDSRGSKQPPNRSAFGRNASSGQQSNSREMSMDDMDNEIA